MRVGSKAAMNFSNLNLFIRLFFCIVSSCLVGRAMSSLKVKIPRLRQATAALFICDVQVKFESLIYRSPTVTNNIALLNTVANILKIPVLVTEQYPKVFGPTVKVGLSFR
jgi:hypothetical protein